MVAKIETAQDERMDVYIRMNGDSEKDYCLSLPRNLQVSELHKLLEKIPVQLSPTYFYDDKPSGFAASIHPGYLTAEGALLFCGDADVRPWIKYLPEETKLSDNVYEGQLVVPLWTWNYRRHFSVITALFFWLYLDLPTFISPTPWTAPTTNFMRLVVFLLPEWEEILPKETDYFNAKPWQVGFFCLHMLKCAFIYFILRVGVWHPASFNFFKNRALSKAKKIPSRDELMSIGWTGSKRVCADDWPEKYRDYRIQRAGGIIKAYKEGLIEKPIGLHLKKGEGWNTFASHKVNALPKVDRNFLDAENKFVLSDIYFSELCKPLVSTLQDETLPVEDKVTKLKQFRSFGYLDGPKPLTDLFEELLPSHPEQPK